MRQQLNCLEPSVEMQSRLFINKFYKLSIEYNVSP